MNVLKEKKFRIKHRTSSMIKDAVDNLPGGVGFFDKRGIPVLVNRTMHRIMFLLTGHDIQDISDLDEIMREPSEILLEDGTVWQFQKRIVEESNALTEITASDITELVNYRSALEKGNEEQREVMSHLEEISRDVVEITRNEEILAMKMRIHSELGLALSSTRHFIASGCPRTDKKEYIERQREMARKLLLQTDMDDETDLFADLKKTAEKLGMEIVCEGSMPEELEGIMTKAVRECLVNTVRHGGGDTVFVQCLRESGRFTAVIRDNGQPKEADGITEGGGLSALRKSVEEIGGTMAVDTKPEFMVTLIFNDR